MVVASFPRDLTFGFGHMTWNRVVVLNLAWVAIVPVLFRAFGPRRAVLLAVFGGFLFLPYVYNEGLSLVPDALLASISKVKLHGHGMITVSKKTVTGFGILLGILIFDRQTLRRFRPHWLDLGMLAFVVLPLASLIANRYEGWDSSINQVWDRFTSWLVLYLAGRLYFGHGEGVRRISAAVVFGGLIYIPFCLYEGSVGPHRYLSHLIYNKPLALTQVFRLGGNRPEVFLWYGGELAAWMALSAVTAFWLLFCGDSWWPWRKHVPTWAPVVALVLTSIYCRGVYGYVVLALGLGTAGLMQLLKSPLPLALLLLIAPIYAAARVSQQWDGHQLIDLAAKAGRPGTVSYRLNAEEQYIAKVKGHNEVWGFGGIDSGIFDFFSQNHLFPDGWWIHILRDGGLVGLTAFLLALFLVPAFVAVFGLPSRTIRGSPISSAWALSLFIALHQTDSLHNRYFIVPTGLMGGALVGLVLLGRASAKEARRNVAAAGAKASPFMKGGVGTRTDQPRPVRDLWLGLGGFAVVLTVLATPELVGLVTGNAPSRPPPPRRDAPVVAPAIDGQDGGTPRLEPAQNDGDDLMRRLKEWDQKQKLRQKQSPP